MHLCIAFIARRQSVCKHSTSSSAPYHLDSSGCGHILFGNKNEQKKKSVFSPPTTAKMYWPYKHISFATHLCTFYCCNTHWTPWWLRSSPLLAQGTNKSFQFADLGFNWRWITQLVSSLTVLYNQSAQSDPWGMFCCSHYISSFSSVKCSNQSK